MEAVFDLLHKDANLGAIDKSNVEQRLRYVSDEIFCLIYHRVSYSLIYRDRLVFALKLAQIKLLQCPLSAELIQILIKGSSIVEVSLSSHIMGGKLTLTQLKQLEEVSKAPIFQNLVPHIESSEDKWINWMRSATPEE